jgi:hydroxylysine kinase
LALRKLMTARDPDRMPLDTGVLSGPARDIPLAAISDHLAQHYALRGKLEPLSGERDRNFRLELENRAAFVVKVAHPAEDPAVIEAQALAANHVRAVDPTVPVQGVLLSATGSPTTVLVHAGEERIVRVVEWLPGQLLATVSLSGGLAASIGATLARLERALRGYSNAHAAQDLLWDLSNAGRLAELLSHLGQDAIREPVEQALAAYQRLLPRLHALPRQVIHADFNPHNLLVDAAGARLVGVLDFGDMQMAPRICDLAIACAYLVGPESDRFSYIEAAVAAYRHEEGLAASEGALAGIDVSMLVDLIAMRLAMSILITRWRAGLHPNNAAYILRNYRTVLQGLSAFDDAGRHALRVRLGEVLAA